MHENFGGVTVTGYRDAAISRWSIAAGGVTFTQADIQDQFLGVGPGAAVFFSQDLANGALPSGIAMLLEHSSVGFLAIGGTECSPCGFSNGLLFSNFS